MIYDFLVVGAGIAGCSVAHFLHKEGFSVAIIDKDGIASGASGSAGAFLSPLLGKPNPFKEFVNKALVFSTEYYKDNFADDIIQCGVLRVAQDSEDEKRFKIYEQYIEFEYKHMDIKGQYGLFFDIGAVVNSKNIATKLVQNIPFFKKTFDKLIYENDLYICDELKAKNIVLCSGANKILDEEYIEIRPVWGQRIDIKCDTKLNYNIHKNNSISMSKNGIISIGATHHVWQKEMPISQEDTNKLINMSRELIDINEYEVIKEVGGARACSVDYFPIIGNIINSKQALLDFPYLKNGTNVQDDRLPKYKNIYMINGLGGRGFVLSPYIGKLFARYIKYNEELPNKLLLNRLFKKWVRK